MKILLVSQDDSERLQVGGKHIHQNILMREWRLAGHVVRCCFPSPDDLRLGLLQRVLYRLTRSWGRYPVRYFSLYVGAIRGSLRARVKQALLQEMPDVISAQDPVAALVCGEVLDEVAGNGRRPAITLTLHGYYTWEMFNYGYYGDQNREAIEAAGFALEREALRRAARVVAVDSRIRQYLVDTLGYAGRVDVVFNAIDLAPFAGAAPRPPVTDGRWRLLVTRRMVLKNGVIVAIEAFAEVLKQAANARLIMVGDGPEMGRVRARARELGIEHAVEFVGAVSHGEVAGFYLGADILLMPSIPSDGIEEATSLSMLEGMAAGNVVVCSAIGGMKEIIRDGVTGYLVPPAAPSALAQRLLAIMAAPAGDVSALTARAIRYAWDHHSAARHAERILALMESA